MHDSGWVSLVYHQTNVVTGNFFSKIKRALIDANFIKNFLSSNTYIGGLIKCIVLVMIASLILSKYQQHHDEQTLADKLVIAPKINDIYFLDFRLFNESLRPKENYRIAKVFDITGDVITLRYGDLLFPSKHKAADSIRFGQLRYSEYFQPERFNFSHQKIQTLRNTGAIYLVKRPFHNKVFGNFVSPFAPIENSSSFILGKREYLSGVAYFEDPYDEQGFSKAFQYFSQSAKLGFRKGQIRLAQMYLEGIETDKDLTLALYWLQQAALQSNKRAIIKYGIVCQQVEGCDLIDFYQFLIENGVNLKVRETAVKLSS